MTIIVKFIVEWSCLFYNVFSFEFEFLISFYNKTNILDGFCLIEIMTVNTHQLGVRITTGTNIWHFKSRGENTWVIYDYIYRLANSKRLHKNQHRLSLNLNLKNLNWYLKCFCNLGMLLNNTKLNLQNMSLTNESLSNKNMKHTDDQMRIFYGQS